jgi:site-specific recombinase XerD
MIALRRLQAHFGKTRTFVTLTTAELIEFMAWLGETEFDAPRAAVPRPPRLLSNKTLRNHHAALSALWTWAIAEGICSDNPMHHIKRPKPRKHVIQPFTDEDIRAILEVLQTISYVHPRGHELCTYDHVQALRNRAILLLLLDTGMRASELCTLTLGGLNLSARSVKVLGKGDKERLLPFSTYTAAALQEYIRHDRWTADRDEPLFVTLRREPLTRNALGQLCRSLGRRAGVLHCHPHRFRHTFAIMFLRAGGNIYALRAILGHTTLQMAQNYLHIMQSDLDETHRTASPVARIARTQPQIACLIPRPIAS